jgi:hypothetical protein
MICLIVLMHLEVPPPWLWGSTWSSHSSQIYSHHQREVHNSRRTSQHMFPGYPYIRNGTISELHIFESVLFLFLWQPIYFCDLPLLKLVFSVIFGNYPLLYRWCPFFLSLWPSALNIDFLHIMYQLNSIMRTCTYLNFTFPLFEFRPPVQNRVPTFKAASHP